MKVSPPPVRSTLLSSSGGEFTLSRLLITGHLGKQTPHCVIKEVAKAHGIVIDNHRLSFPDYKKEVLDFINHSPPLIFLSPLKSRDYAFMARYINPTQNVKWTKKDLKSAFDYLSQFHFHHSLSKDQLDLDFEYGPQTPENIHKLNACVLYRICKQEDFHVQSSTTIEQMAHAVKLWLMGSDDIYRLGQSLLQKLDKTDFIDIFVLGASVHTTMLKSLVKSTQNMQPLSHGTLDQCFDYYADRKKVLFRLDPFSPTEAVALAALLFKKDLSLAKHPMTEYVHLRAQPQFYIPLDTTLKRIHLLRSKLLDLRKTFNPIFPESYYDPEDLKKMSLEEGYKQSIIDSQSPYELLQVSYLLENFYPGIYTEIDNVETPITLDVVNETEPHMIVCYGLRGENMTAFHITGLREHFQTTKSKAHPTDPHSIIDERAMSKLKWIAQQQEGGSLESQREKRLLLQAIQEVELFSNATLSKAKDFYYAYCNSEPLQRVRIEQALEKLLHLSMYMRGWSGPPADFPIREAPTFNQHQVDLKVTQSLYDFERTCHSLKFSGQTLLQLPLLKYQGGFIASNSSSDGRTIQERLDIVKMGNETGNMASCIRLTSNWLAATSHRYLMMIGNPEPFPVEELRYIS